MPNPDGVAKFHCPLRTASPPKAWGQIPMALSGRRTGTRGSCGAPPEGTRRRLSAFACPESWVTPLARRAQWPFLPQAHGPRVLLRGL